MGLAYAYDLRYSTTEITDSSSASLKDTWWNNAAKITGLATPSSAGTEEYVIVGLSSGTTYYFSLKTRDEAPNWSAMSNVLKVSTLSQTQTPTPTPTPPSSGSGGGGGGGGGSGGGLTSDTTPPASPANFKAISADKQINLFWQNPTDTDFVRVLILSTTTAIESSWSKDTLLAKGARIVYEGSKTEFTDVNLDNNTTYYYAIFSYDRKPNYSTPAIIQAQPEAGKVYIPIEREQAPTSSTLPYPNGSLLKTADSDKIYFIVNNQKRWIANPSVFFSYGFIPNSQITVSQADLDKYEEGKEINQPSLKEGVLVRAKNDFKVYIIKPPYKRHIFNPAIFNMYRHFNWQSIKEIEPDILSSYVTSDLYRALNDYRVYSLEEIDEAKGQAIKHHLNLTPAQFTNKGFKWEQIFMVNQEERDYYETGGDIAY